MKTSPSRHDHLIPFIIAGAITLVIVFGEAAYGSRCEQGSACTWVRRHLLGAGP